MGGRIRALPPLPKGGRASSRAQLSQREHRHLNRTDPSLFGSGLVRSLALPTKSPGHCRDTLEFPRATRLCSTPSRRLVISATRFARQCRAGNDPLDISRRRNAMEPPPNLPAPREDAPEAALLPLADIRVIVLYLFFGSLWVIGSDVALDRLEHHDSGSFELQTLKGLNFVFSTTILLYFVLRRSFRRWRSAQEQTQRSRRR